MYAGKVVEEGPVRAVLEAPSHPYTMGLYNAFPDLGRAGGTLVPIEGNPPDLRDPPLGCRFAPRCPFAIAKCREVQPPTVAVAPGHTAACWRLDEAPQLRQLAREEQTWLRSSTSAA
jgi:peptide/nickel transport system ATP-binding protein